jgi:hypothetical protein
LEYLDVSGNFIRHIEDLEDIQHLSQLNTLQLKGNYLCLGPDYPLEVFKLQSHLLNVDEW